MKDMTLTHRFFPIELKIIAVVLIFLVSTMYYMSRKQYIHCGYFITVLSAYLFAIGIPLFIEVPFIYSAIPIYFTLNFVARTSHSKRENAYTFIAGILPLCIYLAGNSFIDFLSNIATITG
ncbi:MAG: hypothetical protein QXL15_04190 [Candidatus Korarchaeota archaeon]